MYRKDQGMVARWLAAAGLAVRRPQATLFVWVPVPAPAEGFALDLLMNTGVTVAPGTFFGPAGEGYVRMAITAPADRIREAMERLQRWAP